MKKLIFAAFAVVLLSCNQSTPSYKVYIISDSTYQKKSIKTDSVTLFIKKGDHLLLTGDYHEALDWFVVTTNKEGIFIEQRYLGSRLTLQFKPYHDIIHDAGYKNLTR